MPFFYTWELVTDELYVTFVSCGITSQMCSPDQKDRAIVCYKDTPFWSLIRVRSPLQVLLHVIRCLVSPLSQAKLTY